MRVVQHQQMSIGEIDVSQIIFDSRSRDDIPKILRGLQHLYIDTKLRAAVFDVLTEQVAPKTSKDIGRPGMNLWSILVCGVLRLDLNIDYDRLQELVNQHGKLREMLGHGPFDREPYAFQTLKDNVSLLTPELLDKINQIVVPAGHELLKKKENEALRGRCDSFVVETNVHFPTDISLLFDAMRKVITLTAQWCEVHGLSDWRQHAYNVRQIKQHMRSAQNKKRSKAKDEAQKAKNDALVVSAHQAYIDLAQQYLKSARETIVKLVSQCDTSTLESAKEVEIDGFIKHAERQIDQIKRRVIDGAIIPHAEKVFSIFEPHTEWISKGKPGVPVELGVKVCILEDQHQFILHHHVMERQGDDQVAVSMVGEAKARFPTLNVCSFDKGFHSPSNQLALAEQLALVALPRKGKLSQAALAIERAPDFVHARRAHSAVESAINALEVHGLDRCPDHGIDGFKRYVALAVVTRNIHRIGEILSQRALRQLQRATQFAERRLMDKLAI